MFVEWFVMYRTLIASCYSLNRNACHIRTPWFASQFVGRWKWISKIQDMGFVHDILIYLNRKEITKKIYGLRYAGGSLRGYFLDLLLQLVPKLPVVMVVFQLLQITSWGFSSSFPWDNFMYKYVINLIYKWGRRESNVMT